MDLADRLIAQKQAEDKKRENNFAPHYGIDDTGLPVPKPVNASYVVMRIMGNLNMYQIGGEFYIGRRRYKQTAQNLIALTGRPHLVTFDDIDEDDKVKQHETDEIMWKQMKNIINSERGLIWERLREVIPHFNKRYLRINEQLVWDRETSDILIIPKGNLYD
jgi:hypothetical protein